MPGWIMAFRFSWHHYAEGKAFYKPPASPFGANFWVRKLVFQAVPFFEETIGATPSNRIMGEETSFLTNLQRQGFQVLDHPGAMVYQSVLHEACTV